MKKKKEWKRNKVLKGKKYEKRNYNSIISRCIIIYIILYTVTVEVLKIIFLLLKYQN